jgi:hypothetical protein
MGRLRLHQISIPLLESIGLIIVILLLAASAQALPESNYSWTEAPWVSDEAGEDEKMATELSAPLAFNPGDAETPSLNIGSHLLNFSELVSLPFSCQLWIRNDLQWSHYLKAIQGEDVDIILYMPEYGEVDVYLISYASGTRDRWSFSLLEGYHLLRLRAEEEGRYFMIAARKSEPGNALILDLVAKSDNASVSPLDVGTIPTGRAMVTIESERIKGYDVYLDGVFYSSDVGDGSIDGVASFTLRADKTHIISISQRDVQGNIINKSEHTKRLKRDMAYTLLIE